MTQAMSRPEIWTPILSAPAGGVYHPEAPAAVLHAMLDEHLQDIKAQAGELSDSVAEFLKTRESA